MHAWNIPGVPDVGRMLYRYVHSLHHKCVLLLPPAGDLSGTLWGTDTLGTPGATPGGLCRRTVECLEVTSPRFCSVAPRRSKNPVAWSGISMHPIESAAYYSAMVRGRRAALLVPAVTPDSAPRFCLWSLVCARPPRQFMRRSRSSSPRLLAPSPQPPAPRSLPRSSFSCLVARTRSCRCTARSTRPWAHSSVRVWWTCGVALA